MEEREREERARSPGILVTNATPANRSTSATTTTTNKTTANTTKPTKPTTTGRRALIVWTLSSLSLDYTRVARRSGGLV